MGRGGMLDIGCYPITTSRFIFGEEPVRVAGLIERDPDFRTDRLASAILEFPSGQAVFTCSTQLVAYQRMQFLGTTGGSRSRYRLMRRRIGLAGYLLMMGRDVFGAGIRIETIPVCDQYTVQEMRFSRAIREGSDVPVPLEDAIGNMAVIEAVFRAGESGGGKNRKRYSAKAHRGHRDHREEEETEMAIRTVLQLGDPGLRKIAKKVDDPAAPEIRMLADDLADTLAFWRKTRADLRQSAAQRLPALSRRLPPKTPAYLLDRRPAFESPAPPDRPLSSQSFRNPGSPSCNTVRIAISVSSSSLWSLCPLCAWRYISCGFSHRPDSPARNTASITAIFPIASSSGTGTSLPSRIARENASPCTVYWSQTGIVSIRIPAPNTSRPSSINIRQARSGGAIKRYLDLDPPCRPKNCILWYATSCVLQVNTACPDGNSRIADANRSVLKSDPSQLAPPRAPALRQI